MRLINVSLVIVVVIGVVAISWIYAASRHSDVVVALPELARDLPSKFSDGDIAFKKRIQDKFPVGTPVRDLITTLASQGFHLSPDRNMASLEQPGLVCRLVWRVFWDADAAEQVLHVGGIYAGVCL